MTALRLHAPGCTFNGRSVDPTTLPPTTHAPISANDPRRRRLALVVLQKQACTIHQNTDRAKQDDDDRGGGAGGGDERDRSLVMVVKDRFKS